jgi:hypothetical protein
LGNQDLTGSRFTAQAIGEIRKRADRIVNPTALETDRDDGRGESPEKNAMS